MHLSSFTSFFPSAVLFCLSHLERKTGCGSKANKLGFQLVEEWLLLHPFPQSYTLIKSLFFTRIVVKVLHDSKTY